MVVLAGQPSMNNREKQALIQQAWEQVKANKPRKLPDGSAKFKLVGGPYHNMEIRAHPPYEEIRFPNGETYELHPPISPRSKKYVYVHKPNLEAE